MTQQQLGERLGIKSQQIQKYETGANRISASRLWDIAAALEADISFFFEGLDTPKPAVTGTTEDLMSDREAVALVRTYHAIPEAQRRLLLELARVLGEAAGKQPSAGRVGLARNRR